MRDPLNKTITTIQPSGIRKFFDVVHEMKDAISLGVGEPDFDTPWHIRDVGFCHTLFGKLNLCFVDAESSTKRKIIQRDM